MILGVALESCDEKNDKPKEFIVTFNSNEGSAVASQTVKEGEKITKPDDPTRDEHTFVAWYKEKGLENKWKFDIDVVIADVTLYAKWEQDIDTTQNIDTTQVIDTTLEQDIVCIVTFISNGGSEVAPQIVKKGDKITKPDDPTRDGYAFVAWWKNKWLVNDFKLGMEWYFDSDVVSSDTTLYAKWEQTTFTVSFDSNGGSEVAPQTVKKGEKVIEPSPTPTKEGFSFGGWYSSYNYTKWDFSSQTVSSDITLCARWISNEEFVGIEGISFENYPQVDGSTSSFPLNKMVACKLLGLGYMWEPWGILFEWTVSPTQGEVPKKYEDFFWNRISNSQTHGAFLNLIDGKADIILTHRTISPDEKTHADAVGVTLIETPIASDAFVFVVHKNNPVKSLTIEQIQKIYTGKITNWLQVGGNNAEMKIFTRPRNSGSEEVFRTLVMKGLEPLNFPANEISTMGGVFPEIYNYVDGICYTFDAYKELQVRVPDSEVPKIAINGIFPNKNTIRNRTYPFISEIYVAIRSDLDRNSMAYKLYEWLQSENAKQTIEECGFIPTYGTIIQN